MVKINKNDWHVIVSGKTDTAKVFDATGKLLRSFNAFPHGVNGPATNVVGGDTVPGTYRYGAVTWTHDSDSVDLVKRPYGRVFIAMEDIEGVEAHVGRAGIGSHGGGLWDDFWENEQKLVWTMGCIRLANKDAVWLGHAVEARRAFGGSIYVTVSQ